MTTKLTLVKVADLVGRDVSGLSADIRSRNADGSLMYGEQDTQRDPIMVTMKRVYVRDERTRPHIPESKEPWLRWEWNGYSCGFSGMAKSGGWDDMHIMIEEAK